MMQVDRRTFLGFSTLATAGVLVDGWGSPLWAQDVRGLPLTKDVATTAGRVRGVVRFGVSQFWGVPYAASNLARAAMSVATSWNPVSLLGIAPMSPPPCTLFWPRSGFSPEP